MGEQPDVHDVPGDEVFTHWDELARVYQDAFAEHPYNEPADAVDGFRRRLDDQFRTPGFRLIGAFTRRRMIGFGCGHTLEPGASWWHSSRTTVPPELATETGGRSFVVRELAVVSACRGMGVGRSLLGALLARRTEERAVLTVPPETAVAQLLQKIEFGAATTAQAGHRGRPGSPGDSGMAGA